MRETRLPGMTGTAWRRIGTPAALIFGAWTGIAALLLFHNQLLGHMPVHAMPYFYDYWADAAITPIIIFIAERSLFTRGRRVRSTLQHLLGVAIFVFSQPAIAMFVLPLLDAVTLKPLPPSSALYWTMVEQNGSMVIWIYIPVSLLSYYITARRREQALALAQSQLRAQLAESRLELLCAQLRPHFLFNSLHTVGALMSTDVKQARATLARLGDLLRVAIENRSGPEATLGAEAAFAGTYLEIEQARFGERMSVRFELAPDTLSAMVPSLLLQPLVENAVKHGVEKSTKHVTITVNSCRVGDTLWLRITDDGPGLEAPLRPGVGLRVSRERLRHMYGAAQDLQVSQRDGMVETLVRLPFRKDASGSEADDPGPAVTSNTHADAYANNRG